MWFIYFSSLFFFTETIWKSLTIIAFRFHWATQEQVIEKSWHKCVCGSCLACFRSITSRHSNHDRTKTHTCLLLLIKPKSLKWTFHPQSPPFTFSFNTIYPPPLPLWDRSKVLRRMTFCALMCETPETFYIYLFYVIHTTALFVLLTANCLWEKRSLSRLEVERIFLMHNTLFCQRQT